MIFVTVGTQLPFDRLTMSIDSWLEDNNDLEVIVQPGKSDNQFKNCISLEEVQPVEWNDFFQRSELIVAHAGMGTILKCLDAGKPLIIMPRRESLGEHRNDHQMATAEKFKDFTGIEVVMDNDELINALNHRDELVSKERAASDNLNMLIQEIRLFVDN